MRLNNLWNTLYFLFEAPTDSNSGGNLSVDDMIDEMGKDDLEIDDEEGKDDKKDDEEDILADDKKKDDKKGKKEKDDEEEIELEADDEPVLDELEPVEDVPRREILKKYPDIFKDFPQLQTAYYREREYAKLLPTLEDAKEAIEKSENYDKFEASVLSGDLDTIMGSAKTADPRAFNKMVDNYLPMLQKVDQQAYFHVIGGVVKNTISAMVREAGNLQNDDLKTAAVILNQFIFGKSEFEAPKSFGPNKPDEATEKLNSERSAMVQEKFEGVLEDLTTKSSNVIKSTISKHIDPKGVMTDYVKRTAIKEALENVEASISSDTRFKATLDKLWEKAFQSNFSRASLDLIQRAHLNKAKVILPAIIQKHKNEALKGLGKRVSGEREEPQKKGPVSQGRAPADNSGKKELTVPKGMRTLDFLMQD